MMPENEPYNTGKRNGTLKRVLDLRQETSPRYYSLDEEDNYYLTQRLSGYGYFYKYLFKVGKMT